MSFEDAPNIGNPEFICTIVIFCAYRAIAVAEECQEITGLSSFDPAGVVISDGVVADSPCFFFGGDFDGEDAVGDFGIRSPFGAVNCVDDTVKVGRGMGRATEEEK